MGIVELLERVSDLVWGPPMLLLLCGTHLYLTFRLRFIQRYLGTALRLSIARDTDSPGDVSQFGALTTALAATIGTGNIVGVATAVSAGGPGAVLWMWLTGVFGIATKYAEALLSVRYRVTNPRGEMAGGPMYVLERGLGWPALGVVFAALTAISAFGIGNTVQANSIASLVTEHTGWPRWATGIPLALLTAAVILGGIRSIATVCEALVPFMAIFYVGGCMVLLAQGLETLPETIALIVRSAFSGQAAVGDSSAPGCGKRCATASHAGCSRTSRGSAARPSSRRPRGRAIRCARRSSRRPARSGTPSSSAP